MRSVTTMVHTQHTRVVDRPAIALSSLLASPSCSPLSRWLPSSLRHDVSLLPLRNDTLWQLNRGIEAIFVLDVLVSSRVAFREHHTLGGRLVRSTDRIASRYVRSSSFALDVIAAVPWELFALALGSGGRADAVWGADSPSAAAVGSRNASLPTFTAVGSMSASVVHLVRLLSLAAF